MSEWTPAEMAVWEHSFRRIQRRFEALATPSMRVGVVLATLDGAEIKPSAYPPSLPIDTTPLCETGLLTCLRTSGEASVADELMGISDDAGALLPNSPDDAFLEFMADYGVAHDRTFWVYFVFQLAWQRRRGTPLEARKQVWCPVKGDSSGAYATCPVEYLEEFARRPSLMESWHGDIVKWNPAGEYCWFSQIDDFASASVAAIDWLILDGSRRRTEAAATNATGAAKTPHTRAESPQGTGNSIPPATAKPKQATGRDEAQEKLKAALTVHHKYQDGSCLEWRAIGVRELAKQAITSPSSASAFFSEWFESHRAYIAKCQSRGQLIFKLQLMNGEVRDIQNYGTKPPGEGDRDDD